MNTFILQLYANVCHRFVRIGVLKWKHLMLHWADTGHDQYYCEGRFTERDSPSAALLWIANVKKKIVFQQVCVKQWNCRRNLWGCVQVYRKWISSKTVSWRDESSLEQNASVSSSQQTMAHQCKHILDALLSQPGKKSLPKWLGPSSMKNSLS